MTGDGLGALLDYDTAGRCDCCDLPTKSCGKAKAAQQRADAAAERARLLDLPGWVAAQFPGSCARCGERFAVGEPIRRTVDGWAAWCCPEGTP